MKASARLLAIAILMIFTSIHLKSQLWEDHAVGLLPVDFAIQGIAVVDQDVVWAIAYEPGNVTQNHVSKILKTTNGGQDWRVIDVTDAIGRATMDIVAFDSSVAFIATHDFDNGVGKGVFKTVDGGANWIETLSGSAGRSHIRFLNASDGVAWNNDTIATTSDGGNTWSSVPFSQIPSFRNQEHNRWVNGTNSAAVQGNRVWCGTNQGRVYRSIDKGHTWDVFQTPVVGSGVSIASLAFIDTLTGIVLNSSEGDQFAITRDGGQSWKLFNSTNNNNIRHITYVPGTDSTLIGVEGWFFGNVVYYSTDFGRNWLPIGTGYPFSCTQFISPDIGWTSNGRLLSASDPAMFKWDGDILGGEEIKKDGIGLKVFPNPTTDKLQVHLDQIYSWVTLEISTLTGQILSRETYSHANLITANLKGSKGIYLLTLSTTDGLATTVKVVKQ